ncbi:MauE/DoxX family redox-associated membrane protein [Sphingobacterium chuzhouense]|uniref:Methylamine utilisation protein MauE domain-containing protein n=1 Tax=Sphingobacterium chuzhouense TaxID=1742264 RepID=A0ABR7XR10_9SPHI|nr:MauE/DoxX family redox-associated membrane protein [Sphingobacterium chuzhouense]MBD1421614.1 hypothetical protein [Sphingobacterium chuzhouense]
MKTRITHITSHSLHIFLMLFWLYVALDKLWDLPNFHRALLKQPFPDGWANILYWALPMAELGLALLFVLSRKGYTYVLSAFLMLSFTIYIGLGVAGFYAKRPCGCASVFSGLSWDWHLLANIVLLGLSILGRFLCGSPAPTDHGKEQYAHAGRSQPTLSTIAIPLYDGGFFIRIRFPRRFAPFPGRPV